jgi:cytochrome c553
VPCATCHGFEGRSQTDGVPSLAGQPDQFIQWQLVYFRSGTRKDPVMQPFAAALSDADIRNLGAYFASLPASGPAPAADEQPALTERGAMLAARHHCASCHQDNYAGQQATARLAGQREEYLVKALRDFKSGARTGGGVAAMPSAAYPLTADDIAALAHYLARFP